MQLRLLTWELRAEMDADKRREMRRMMSGLMEELGDLKDKRNEEVAEVRFRQGEERMFRGSLLLDT